MPYAHLDVFFGGGSFAVNSGGFLPTRVHTKGTTFAIEQDHIAWPLMGEWSKDIVAKPQHVFS
jgi:hypothetical protein